MYKNTPKTYFMGGATPTDMTMINRGVFFMGGADTSTQNWKGKPADWSDIRKDCPDNSIALYAAHAEDFSSYDNLGFTATCTGGYNVFIDEKKYGTFASGSQCSITWSNTFIDKDLPIGYRRITGFSTNNDCYYQITNFRLTGADTIKFSFEFSGTACNVLGSYTTSSAEDNLSLYIGTNTGAKYLRYDGGTASSYCKADTRYDVQITPTGSIGFETESTWEQKTFTCPVDFLVGTTGVAATSSKFIGTFYGNIEVVGRLNLIPCERESDNTICLYDTYSQTFYEPIGTNPTSLGYDNSRLINGDDITTPSALKAHKIWIEPATSGNNITAFHCERVGISGQEEQGVLWSHFNIRNSINLAYLMQQTGNHVNRKLVSITALNNKIIVSNLFNACRDCAILEYTPVFDGNNGTVSLQNAFIGCYVLTSLSFKNLNATTLNSAFYDDLLLKEIKTSNVNITPTSVLNAYTNNRSIEKILDADYTNLTEAGLYITLAKNLKDTVLDVSAANGLTRIGCYGNSQNFMTGFKGLRVSSQAPFNNATAPQINVSYTGMNRQALVTLFNDLPAVSDGQIINITGCTGSEDLTAQDVIIATNKGWTVTGGPVFTDYYAYTNVSDSSVYTTDNPINRGTFALQNATVVGTLTENDGVYSGFGNSTSYIDLGQTYKSTNNAVYIIKFKTGTNISTDQQIFCCEKLFSIGIYNYKLNTYNWQTSSSTAGAVSISPQTEYYAKLEINGTTKTFSYKAATDANYTQLWTGSDTGIDVTANYDIRVGTHSFISGGKFLGSVDMYETSVSINGVTTYFGTFNNTSVLYNNQLEAISPQPRYAIVKPHIINANIEGTLTEDNGVYSGFTTSNYINMGQSLKSNNNASYVVKFKTGNSTSGTQQILCCDELLSIMVESGQLKSYNWQTSSVIGATNISANTEYYAKMEINGTTRVFSYKLATDANYTQLWSGTDTGINVSANKDIYIGLHSPLKTSPFGGSVDLKETYVTINGTTTALWFDKSTVVIDNVDYVRTPTNDLLG